MFTVDPSIAAFGMKCAGVFWKDMPVHHNIATEMSVLNGGKNDPETILSVLPAKRTQEPRLLTRLFSSPRGHYNTVRGALDYHGIQDPHYRAYVGGEVLKELWPKIYKPLEKKPDFNRPTDLFEHFYVELAKKKKKKAPAKEKKAEDEKQAISARLAAKALTRASQRAAKGEISPERLKRFVNKTERWAAGAHRRAGNNVDFALVKSVPKNEDATNHFVGPIQYRRLPDSIAAAYEKTRARIPHRDDIKSPSTGMQQLITAMTGKPYDDPAERVVKMPKQRASVAEIFGSSGHYDPDTHSIGGKLLASPPALFHELGHGLDFGGRDSRGIKTRLGQELLSESVAWRRGTQLYDTWRKSLPQENKADELDAAEMPTTRDILRARHIPLETYRLGHLRNLVREFNDSVASGNPVFRTSDYRPNGDIGPTGRVFSQAEQALKDSTRQLYEQQEAQRNANKPTSKAANFLNDYAYHFNKLYNPESYGFDVRTPTGRDDLRNIAVSTAVGTGLGAIRGAIWPGYIEKLDEAGRVLSKKKRGRLLGSLRDALTSGALSGISSAAGITAKKYMPEIEQALIKAKDTVASKLPIRGRVIHEGVDANQPLLARVQGAV